MINTQTYRKEMPLLNYLFKIMMRIFLLLALITSSFIFSPASASTFLDEHNSNQALEAEIYLPLVGNSFVGTGNVYYLSPTGDDSKSGHSEADAWETFKHAWQFLYPGDTLILLDGTYYQSIAPNVRNGEPGYPITIKAKNDGKAIIDGQNQRTPVSLKHELNGWKVGDWFGIEGIIAHNSSGNVYQINGDHNILRRVSGYNANTDRNNHVFVFSNAKDNLVEDCVAAGSGRKMIIAYKSENITVRRCFADWQEWDGRNSGQCWPWGESFDIYNSDNISIENSISYSRIPAQSITVRGQGSGDTATEGNKILGSMAFLAGMKEDGTPMVWGETRPQPTEHTCVRNFNWPSQRSGFAVYESGAAIRNNLWQDIFAWGNAGLGIAWTTGVVDSDTSNNRVIRATIYNNGLDNPVTWGGIGTDALQSDLNRYSSVENSFIEKIHTSSGKITMNGEGARLTHRYVDGELSSEPLWPWPMEDRIQAELGFSVTDFVTNIIFGTSDLTEIYP